MRRSVLLGLLLLLVAVPAAQAGTGCDPIDAAACLYPWPNDWFTKPDATTATGRRLNLTIDEMPKNAAGVPIDPTAFNRNDGFSPGTLIVTKVPGLDTPAAFAANDFPTNTDTARSFDPHQRAVVIDATDRHHPRQRIWAELEYPPSATPDAANQTLIIHPGKNFAEGHRYIVALRDLVGADGKAIAAPAGFAGYRDGKTEDTRTKHFEHLFTTLKKAGVERGSLYLAWDFTVASERNLSERMLHMRDQAFGELGDNDLADVKVQGSSPTFAVYPDLPDDQVSQVPDLPEVGNPAEGVDGVTNYTAAQNPRIKRIVRGRVVVPCYLDTPECAPGGSFVYGLDGLPIENPATRALADFVCIVPRSATPEHPARPSLYGHGLLGDASQVAGGSQQALAFEQDLMLCATDWSGMSTEDLPNDVAILADLSHFDSLADRGQQGMLNFMYLGRALIHPQGMSTDPAFQEGGKSLIDTNRLYYDGGSQGGIMGGSLTAVAPDFTRAALGVPGMNYSVLLQRSVDFDTYATVMYNAYPDLLQRPLILSLIQLQWDRAEADGYAQHITTDPYPNTPPHEVLLGMAYGDHQVSNWTTIVEARTIGAQLRTPAISPFREIPGSDIFDGIDTIKHFPATGSELFVADVGPLRTVNGSTKGTPPPPVGNEPNRPGVDPHGPDESEQVYWRNVIGHFLMPDDQSVILDPGCDGPCLLDGWDGNP